MIATHNSFTYLRAKNPVMEILAPLWRCQGLTLGQQWKAGARYFDVRVAAERDGGKTIFRLCHGRADLRMMFSSVPALDTYMRRRWPKAAYRLVLERGSMDSKGGETFLRQAGTLIREAQAGGGIIDAVIVKHPWTVVFQRGGRTLREYYCHPLNWNTDMPLAYNLRHLDLRQVSIRGWARRHNPPITKEMVSGRDTVHMMDYLAAQDGLYVGRGSRLPVLDDKDRQR